MKTVRRLYFYAVALISLEVVLWGIIGLLRSILDAKNLVDNAQALAQALSLILVGVPIFLFHWLWAQRVSAKEDEEKTASLRAVFLYGILLGTLIPAVQNFLALINRIFLSSAHLYTERAIVGGSQSILDNIIALLINLLIASYFWNVLRKEWLALPDPENFSELRRLYRFIWMLYGLLMVIYGTQQALNFAFTLSSNVLGEIRSETVVNAIALLVIGTPIWFFSWRILQNALTDSAEKESALRLGLLYLLSLSGVVIVLTAGGNLLYVLFNRLFGVSMPLNELLIKIGNPISLAVPFGMTWAYYGNWLNQQIGFEEQAPRRDGKKRIYFYILSVIGLVASFVGMALLFSYIIDVGLGNTYLSTSGSHEPLCGALATLAVGLPLWLLAWRPMQDQALAEGDSGDHARRSIVRKTYLYLALFAGVIGGMISSVTLVFTLINTALGGNTSNFSNSILNSLQLLVLFVVLLVYHFSALRKDGLARADVLEAKQEQFDVLVFDNGDGKFGESTRAAFVKHAPKVPVTVLKANEQIPSDVKANAVVLPGSLAVDTPAPLEAWIRSFTGSKLIVSDEAAGVYWVNDFAQVAQSVRALAEGQDLRPQSKQKAPSAWTYVAYVFAALFALQLLFLLIMLGVSLVTSV
jgi:hypothetical protein